MCDVMWAAPDGRRVLLVSRPEVGAFVSAVYRFDATEVVPLDCRWDGRTLSVAAGPVEVELRAGRGWRIPLRRLRSRPALRRVEAPLARRLLGVEVFGTSPTGVSEWYRADRYRPVKQGRARVGGDDAGTMGRFASSAGFGFSEPPRRPSVVHVRPLLTDPTGALGEAAAGSAAR